jgi:hypothetical protein
MSERTEEVLNVITTIIAVIALLISVYVIGFNMGLQTAAKTRYAEAYESYCEKLEEIRRR